MFLTKLMNTLAKTSRSCFWLMHKTGISLSTLLIAGSLAIRADTISDNLSSSSAGTEAATGDTWLATSFTTSATSTTLGSVTLVLGNLTSSSVMSQLALYADDGLNEPGVEIGILTTNSAYVSTLGNVTFSGGNLALSAGSTYWLVLSTTAGELDWSYAADDAGSGSGFTDTYSESYDSGSTWYTYASNQAAGVYPLQVAVESGISSISTAPEPGSAWLLMAGCALIATGSKTSRRPRTNGACENIERN